MPAETDFMGNAARTGVTFVPVERNATPPHDILFLLRDFLVMPPCRSPHGWLSGAAAG